MMKNKILEKLIDEIEKIREPELEVLSRPNSYHPYDVAQARLVNSTCENIIKKIRELIESAVNH